MMKNIYYILFLIVTLGLVSCSDNSLEGDSNDGNAMSVNMTVAVPLYQSQETSSRAGAADPDGDALRSIYLLCFDENGYYLSKTKANLSVTNADADALAGKISGTVPSNTCRIHFVANANMTNIDDTHYKGVSENVMIPSLYSGYGIVNYWGYKRCSSASEMKTFLTGNNSVELIRNQARVTVVINESADKTYTINGLAVCNLRAFGTVALYDKTKFASETADPYTSAFNDEVVSSLSDDKNIAADDPTDVSSDKYYNIFEGTNTKSSPMVAIIKIDGYYHKILLQDPSYNFLTIHRNHEYRINIKKLTEQGYSSFESAKNGVAANNPFITIDDIVASLDYGNYSLSFPDGTSQIFNEGGTQTIKFKYTNSSATPEADDIAVSWELNSGIATGTPTVTKNADGTFSISINLTDPSKTLQSGKLSVQIKGTPLVKTIKVYSIQAFEFTPLLLSKNVEDAVGKEVAVEFNIPSDFPAELLPLKCKIVTNRFDAASSNQLQVITESTHTSDLDNVDWNYKYLYYATTTGPQRIYFKTVDSGYLSGVKNTKLYVQAANFKTASSNFGFSSPYNALKLSDASAETYTSDATSYDGQQPMKGKQLTVYYEQPAAKTIYICSKNFKPKGAYTTVKDRYGMPCYSISGSKTGSVTLVSQNTTYSENVWFESDYYQSASVKITANASYYIGELRIAISSKPKYGPNVEVPFTFHFPVAGKYYIHTKDLTPVSGQGITVASSGIYEYTASSDNLSKTLKFVTKNLVNTETVTVALADNSSANVPSASVVLTNKPISGTFTCATEFSASPFAYIEDGSQNRVGVITLTKTSNTTCTYTLTLRSYYNLSLTSGVNIFTTDAQGNTRKCTATIKGLLESPDRTLE